VNGGTRSASAKPITTPDLKLRRTWHDGGRPREDYEVIAARGERVGRMYSTIAVGGFLPNSVNSSCDNRPTSPRSSMRDSHNCFGLRLNF